MTRCWKVAVGVPEGRGINFTPSGFPLRSYASEPAARAAAVRLTTEDEGGCRFVAARLWHPSFPVGIVEEYHEGKPHSLDLLAQLTESDR